jgi:adenylosuccinate synthase
MSYNFIIGLQYGDEGKGKVASALAALANTNFPKFNKKNIRHVRYNGGPNAGHTVNYSEDVTLALHQIPCGAAYRQKSHIGPGVVISFKKLEAEAKDFEKKLGFSPYEYLTIDPKAIVISEENVSDDYFYHSKAQGSTSSGIAPAYSDFYNRTAKLAKDYTWPHKGKETIQKIHFTDSLFLFEGAQGHYLNPYQGSYPYTTSSSSHPAAAALSCGFPVQKIETIVGVAKCYETRSGIDPDFHKVMNKDGDYIEPFYPNEEFDDKSYKALAKLGNEVGVTTGRDRNIRWLDLTRLIKAIEQTGTNILIIQKWDILAKLSHFGLYYNGCFLMYSDLQDMLDFIKSKVVTLVDHLIFNGSPHPASLHQDLIRTGILND